jgi:signal transduction histidine kinase
MGKIKLLKAIFLVTIISSILVTVAGGLAVGPLTEQRVRALAEKNQRVLVDFFAESVQQEIIVGNYPSVFRKCELLLSRNPGILSISIVSSTGQTICSRDARSAPQRLLERAVKFGSESAFSAAQLRLGFDIEEERKLAFWIKISAATGIFLIFALQLVILIPVLRNIIGPLEHLGQMVADQSPEAIAGTLSESISSRSRIFEIEKLFEAFVQFARKLVAYRDDLVRATRFEAVANTVQIIAHDLKAPLAVFERAMRGSASDFLEARKSMQSAHLQLIQMVDSIKKADLDAIVRPIAQAIPMLELQNTGEALAAISGVSFNMSAKFEVRDVLIDRPKAVRAIQNLVKNACEAARSQVGLFIDADISQVYVRVVDDGPGLPVEMVDRLFEKGATSGKADGTGMGLFFAQSVAQGHGTAITYHRDSGCSVFTITFTRDSLQLISQTAPDAVTPRPSEAVSATESKILLVSQDASRIQRLSLIFADRPDDVIMMEESIWINSGKPHQCLYLFSDKPEILSDLVGFRGRKILYDIEDPDSRVQQMIMNLSSLKTV